MTTLKERIRLAFDLHPQASQAELARVCGVSQPSVNDWLSGKSKSMKAEPLRRAAIYFGCDPYWLGTGAGQPNWQNSQHLNEGAATRGVAHEVSHLQRIVLPIAIEWESIMQGRLPGQFVLATRDTALQPKFASGTRFIFDTARQPQAGDVVLVRDADGHHYIREYHLLRAGQWLAAATNQAYSPMQAPVDGITVVAVAIGALWA